MGFSSDEKQAWLGAKKRHEQMKPPQAPAVRLRFTCIQCGIEFEIWKGTATEGGCICETCSH